MSCSATVCPPCLRYPQPRSGFTLAEVVVATLIFGLAATVLVQSASDALRAYQLSRTSDRFGMLHGDVRRHVLKILSRTELEEGGELEVPYVTRNADTGEAETELIRVRWEVEIHPTRILDVYVLDLTAHFESDGATDSITEQITTYRPTWGEADEVEQLVEAKEQEFEDRLSARGAVEDEEANP